jgi:hypothetical protein
MKMTREEVIKQFYSLDGAFSDGVGDHQFVYVPGTRKDRVLLVAHADTVWDGTPVDVKVKDNIIYSGEREKENVGTNRFNGEIKRRGVGIGADDRAGCAALWSLRNLGHSLMITSGEEKGCISARWLTKTAYWQGEINDAHQFAIELDRRGRNDIVFYEIATKAFTQYAKKQTGYKPCGGSFSDICVLCDGICGVNISVGYYNEHTIEEKIRVDQWLNTLMTVARWIRQRDLPRFEQSKTDVFSVYTGYSGNYNYGNNWYQNTYGGGGGQTTPTQTSNQSTAVVPVTKTDAKDAPPPYVGAPSMVRFVCKRCQHKCSEQDWFEAKLRCPNCHALM